MLCAEVCNILKAHHLQGLASVPIPAPCMICLSLQTCRTFILSYTGMIEILLHTLHFLHQNLHQQRLPLTYQHDAEAAPTCGPRYEVYLVLASSVDTVLDERQMCRKPQYETACWR